MTFKEELGEVLEKELNILIDLKEIAFKKTDMIVGNQVQELEQMTNAEGTLINKIALLEEERIRLLDTWGIAINTPISNVIERIPEEKEELIHIKDKMGRVLEELSIRNALNNDLITENLDWIDFNMNLITSSDTPVSYGKGNNGPGGNSIFDRKV